MALLIDLTIGKIPRSLTTDNPVETNIINMMPIMTSCGLYYKPITIVNDDSRVVNKLETLLNDDARVIIYDHHMFIVQDSGLNCDKNDSINKLRSVLLCWVFLC